LTFRRKKMAKLRVPETGSGITGEFTVQSYDLMQRNFKDKGWIETKLLIQEGISSGIALEIGPGPGYLGLEWLKKTEETRLQGLEISEDMIAIAKKNAAEYNLLDRVEYSKGDAQRMPFEDEYFDAVFTNGSLHEWAHPENILNEIARVLKPGGRYFISDMRRDMNILAKWFLLLICQPKNMRSGLISSINASYMFSEIKNMVQKTKLQGWHARKNLLGIVITGQKPA
jgi:ubiquinone/menaquinone biosynthesis C-methylase UbiE